MDKIQTLELEIEKIKQLSTLSLPFLKRFGWHISKGNKMNNSKKHNYTGSFQYIKLSKEQLEKVTKIQEEMIEKFRNVPESGKEIDFLGKKFIVYKNVFWPFEFNEPLIKNFEIKNGDDVLDVGTGSGVIAVLAAEKGANKIVALDINPNAVKSTKENAKLHGYADKIDARLSNMFESLKENEKFDVIIANLPFRDRKATDNAEQTMWDTGFKVSEIFLKNSEKYLKTGGRIYLLQGNFGNLRKIMQLVKEYDYQIKLIGKKKMSDQNPDDPRIIYAFKLTKL